ncbi:MAG: TldD/PmbA family protein, partial [Methanotrichaceae archaeon]
MGLLARMTCGTLDKMIEDLIERARSLLLLAEQAGAEESEVFGLDARSVDLDLRKDSVEMASESYNRGLGLRAVVNGAVGFSSTSDLSKLDMVAESAIRSAKARGADEKWRSLPLREELTRPQDIFDPAIEKISSEDCLEMSAEMLKGCALVSGVEPSSGGVVCASITELIVNSNGIEFTEKSTILHLSLEAVARGRDVTTGYEFGNSRMLQSDFEKVGRSAAELAKRSLGGVKGETRNIDVLLRPIAFADLLEYAFVPSICADNVQKGRSFLAGKIGETVAEDSFSIVDDGLLKGGMASSAFDGEGVPSQNTTIIEKGALKSFLYDSYTAGKEGTRSTGNGMRGGYSGVPGVSISNLIVSSEDPSDLVADTRKGVLVNGVIGAHTANPVSGDFSVEARNVFQVVDGEIKKP